MTTPFLSETPEQFKQRVDQLDSKIKRYKSQIAQHQEKLTEIEGQAGKEDEVRSRKRKIQDANMKIERISAEFYLREKNAHDEVQKLFLDEVDKMLEEVGSELRVIRDKEAK